MNSPRQTHIPKLFIFILSLLLGFSVESSAAEFPDPFTPPPKPKATHGMTAERLARAVWRGFHNSDSLLRLVDKRYGLVVGGYKFGGGNLYPGPTQLCPNDPEFSDAMTHIEIDIYNGLQSHDGRKQSSPSCAVEGRLLCTLEHGVIDPPDSDFSRLWLFFQVNPAGRLLLHGVYFGYYNDDTEAINTGATPRKACP